MIDEELLATSHSGGLYSVLNGFRVLKSVGDKRSDLKLNDVDNYNNQISNCKCDLDMPLNKMLFAAPGAYRSPHIET